MDSSVAAMAAWRTIRPHFPAYDGGRARVVTTWVSLVRGTVPVCPPGVIGGEVRADRPPSGHRDLPGPLRAADPGDRRGEQRGHAGLGGIGGRRLGGALLFTGGHTGTVPRTSDTHVVTTRARPAS